MTTTEPRARVTRLPKTPRRRHRWKLVAVLAVVVLLLGGGAYTLWETQLLAVRTVSVTGSAGVPLSQVRDVADIPLGTPLIRLDTAAVAHRVTSSLPTVDTVSVHRSWPSTVRLVVTERDPVAVVEAGGHYRLIDREGVPYRSVGKPPAGFVVLQLTQAGPRDPATHAALDVLAALPEALRKQVRYISAPGPRQVTLSLTGDRTVLWGDAADSERKATVLAALLHRSGKYYDLSGDDVVTVH